VIKWNKIGVRKLIKILVMRHLPIKVLGKTPTIPNPEGKRSPQEEIVVRCHGILGHMAHDQHPTRYDHHVVSLPEA
jgi:hypothetical protein